VKLNILVNCNNLKIENTITPVKNQIERSINAQIIQPFYGDDVAFELRSTASIDIEMQIKEREAYKAYTTYNEMVSMVDYGEPTNEEWGDMPTPMALAYFAKKGELLAMQEVEISEPDVPIIEDTSPDIEGEEVDNEVIEGDGMTDEANEGLDTEAKGLATLDNGTEVLTIDKPNRYKVTKLKKPKEWQPFPKGVGLAGELANA
jgi:hypothetical protein